MPFDSPRRDDREDDPNDDYERERQRVIAALTDRMLASPTFKAMVVAECSVLAERHAEHQRRTGIEALTGINLRLTRRGQP